MKFCSFIPRRDPKRKIFCLNYFTFALDNTVIDIPDPIPLAQCCESCWCIYRMMCLDKITAYSYSQLQTNTIYRQKCANPLFFTLPLGSFVLLVQLLSGLIRFRSVLYIFSRISRCPSVEEMLRFLS